MGVCQYNRTDESSQITYEKKVLVEESSKLQKRSDIIKGINEKYEKSKTTPYSRTAVIKYTNIVIEGVNEAIYSKSEEPDISIKKENLNNIIIQNDDYRLPFLGKNFNNSYPSNSKFQDKYAKDYPIHIEKERLEVINEHETEHFNSNHNSAQKFFVKDSKNFNTVLTASDDLHEKLKNKSLLDKSCTSYSGIGYMNDKMQDLTIRSKEIRRDSKAKVEELNNKIRSMSVNNKNRKNSSFIDTLSENYQDRSFCVSNNNLFSFDPSKSNLQSNLKPDSSKSQITNRIQISSNLKNRFSPIPEKKKWEKIQLSSFINKETLAHLPDSSNIFI